MFKNKARRRAIQSRKSSDSQTQTALTARNNASGSTGLFSGIIPNFQSQTQSSEPQEHGSPCGSDCWIQRALLAKSGDVSITIPPLDDVDQDRVNMKIYQGLRPWQTRLLVLRRGELGTRICCNVITVDVIDGPGLGISGTSDVVAYEALSYAWGPPAIQYSITCNGAQLGVTEALAWALQYLRLRDAERYLWCDAICINQQDLHEKALQVKSMIRIFEKADRVIAWLGRPLATSAIFFASIDLVGPKLGRAPPQMHDPGCATAIRNVALAVSEHLECAWFRRTWIRQEVFAAKKLILQTGHLQSDFITFITSLLHIQMTVASMCASDDHVRIPSTLETYEREYQHFGSDGSSFEPTRTRSTYVEYWLDIINTGYRFQVTDERDRIYGALGLLTSRIVKFFAEVPEEHESMAKSFPIDYSKSVSRVHEDVIKFLINATKTLEILDIFHKRLKSVSPEIAFWTPDLSRKQTRYLLPRSRYPVGNNIVGVHTQDHLDVGKLRLAGVRVAKTIQQLDGQKEIGHPQDRFTPKYRRSITLNHIMQGPLRRSTSGLPKKIGNPPYAFVFSHVKKSEQTGAVLISHELTKSEDIDASFAKFLSSSDRVFAYVEDFEDTSSFDLASLHFLVPRTTSLDDTIVSLYGSRCLHLIRPRHNDPPEWTYMGPIAAVAIGHESINKYHPADLSNPSSRIGPKDVNQHVQEAEDFAIC